MPAARQRRVAVAFEQHRAAGGQLERRRGLDALDWLPPPTCPERLQPLECRRRVDVGPGAACGAAADRGRSARRPRTRQRNCQHSSYLMPPRCHRRADAPAYLIYRRTGLDEIDGGSWLPRPTRGRGRSRLRSSRCDGWPTDMTDNRLMMRLLAVVALAAQAAAPPPDTEVFLASALGPGRQGRDRHARQHLEQSWLRQSAVVHAGRRSGSLHVRPGRSQAGSGEQLRPPAATSTGTTSPPRGSVR